jgi:hypothetical protein
LAGATNPLLVDLHDEVQRFGIYHPSDRIAC